MEHQQFYLNYYQCMECDVTWEMEWDCMCDDPCPKCGHANEPFKSEELDEEDK